MEKTIVISAAWSATKFWRQIYGQKLVWPAYFRKRKPLKSDK